MNLPQLPLGVRVMDEDHYALEQMFAGTESVDDAGLRAHLDAILAEIAAHFGREEAEMERVGVPVLQCHRLQHAVLLAEAEKIRQAFGGAANGTRRRLIAFNLARLVADHVASVDRISSGFCPEKIDYSVEP
ncbi:MAG TPA: hemerythrin domain-containing protein [Rhodoblastus sp.]|nr:hemerythrin domain-containing protein [Rhodoblastus sp.]